MRRRLGVPGEAALIGRGVSHCATCDGGFFRGQTVVVVGGGDSALDEALVLAGVVGRVVLVHRGDAFDATQGQADAIAATPNVEVRFGSVVDAVEGDGAVLTGVVVRDLRSGNAETIPAAGLFVYVGLSPETGWLEGVAALDAEGRVVVDTHLAASVPGLFAAGDVRSGTRAMLDEAVEDGVRAARSALAYLAGGATQ